MREGVDGRRLHADANADSLALCRSRHTELTVWCVLRCDGRRERFQFRTRGV